MPLTATACQNAKAKGKPRKLSDGGGLHMLITPDGSKYWRLAYRFHGKQRTLACGVYPVVGLTDARATRDAAKRNLANGIDPSAAKQERARVARVATGNTFEARAREWYARWKPTKTPDYAEQVMRRFEADVFPAIGNRPIADIEAPEILDALRKVEKRGAIESARRLRQMIGLVFRFAIAEGHAKRDPSADLRGALQEVQTHHHKAMPCGDLPVFLRTVQAYDGEPRTRLALRLIVLTFVRTTELRAGRWEEIDDLEGKAPIWRIPAARMKRKRDHLVPLSRQSVATLRELRALSGQSPYVFPSPGKEGCMSNNTMLFALYRMGYHGRATVHGFRGVASTILNENDFNSDWIERQLAHVEENKIRGAYNAAEWLPKRREMMQWWADHLDALTLERDNVVTLRAG
jgi:integrase